MIFGGYKYICDGCGVVIREGSFALTPTTPPMLPESQWTILGRELCEDCRIPIIDVFNKVMA